MTLVFGGLFPAVGTIHHYAAGILVEGSRASWLGVFKNPNEDAYCLAVLVPIAAALAGQSKRFMRVMFLAIIGLYLVAIFLTFSRGGLLGLFAALGLIGWKQKSVLIRMSMVVVLVLGVAAGGAFWARDKDFNDVSNDVTFRQRISTIIAGGRMFLDHPLFGVGPGCSMVAYPLYVPTEYLDCGCQTQLVIHNSFVQVLSELGVLGFLSFMTLLGASVVAARRIRSGSIAPYASALDTALWVFVVCSLSGGFAYTWSPYILFGLVVAAKRIADRPTPEGAPA
jgi:O-antigen ligase